MWFLLTTLPWASLFDDIMGSTPALSSDSIMQTPFSTSVIDLPAAAPPADSATSRFSDIMSSSPPPALSSDSIMGGVGWVSEARKFCVASWGDAVQKKTFWPPLGFAFTRRLRACASSTDSNEHRTTPEEGTH